MVYHQSYLQLEEDLGADPFASSLQDMLSKHQIDIPHIATILPALKGSDWLPVDDALPFQTYRANNNKPSSSSPPPLSLQHSLSYNSPSSPPSPVMMSTTTKLRSPASQARMFLDENDDDHIPQRDGIFKTDKLSKKESFRLNTSGARSRSGSDARGGSMNRASDRISGGGRSRSGSDALTRSNSFAGDLAGVESTKTCSTASGRLLMSRTVSGPINDIDVEKAREDLFKANKMDLSPNRANKGGFKDGRKSPSSPTSPPLTSSRMKSVKNLFLPVGKPNSKNTVNMESSIKPSKLESKKSMNNMNKKKKKEKAKAGSEWDDDGDISDVDREKKGDSKKQGK